MAFHCGVLGLLHGHRLIGIRSTPHRVAAEEWWVLPGWRFEPFFTFNISRGQINLYLILMVTLDCLVVPARHRVGWLGLLLV